ncbi:hypothetical protein ACHAXR_002094, partial [Thalassiosira sp. AJA248-18]
MISLPLNLLLSLLAVLPIAARHGPSSLAALPRKGVPVNPVSSRRSMAAFGDSKYFTDRYIPADKPGVVLKVPNFDVLFAEIQKVSPLAKQAIMEDNPGGIKSISDADDVYKWKVTDNNPNRLVSHVDKIDNFQNKGVPLLRFRSTLHGPAKNRAEMLSELVSVTDMRQRWDATNDVVDTIYSAANMKEVEELQEYKYGEVSLFGIGYVKTKQTVVSPREQMTLCGLQNFPSGAAIIWGVELEEDQNHLFPGAQSDRNPRSTSHIFCQTLVPTGEDTFDVEYVIQLEVGGFPGWLTGPIIGETIKKMFSFADGYFKSGLMDGGELAKKLDMMSDNEQEVSAEDPGDSLLESNDKTGVSDQEQTLVSTPRLAKKLDMMSDNEQEVLAEDPGDSLLESNDKTGVS